MFSVSSFGGVICFNFQSFFIDASWINFKNSNQKELGRCFINVNSSINVNMITRASSLFQSCPHRNLFPSFTHPFHAVAFSFPHFLRTLSKDKTVFCSVSKNLRFFSYTLSVSNEKETWRAKRNDSKRTVSPWSSSRCCCCSLLFFSSSLALRSQLKDCEHENIIVFLSDRHSRSSS